MRELQLPPAQLSRLQNNPAQAMAPAHGWCSLIGRVLRAISNAIGLCGRGRRDEATLSGRQGNGRRDGKHAGKEACSVQLDAQNSKRENKVN